MGRRILYVGEYKDLIVGGFEDMLLGLRGFSGNEVAQQTMKIINFTRPHKVRHSELPQEMVDFTKGFLFSSKHR